jgi:hypothetical protein
MVYLDRQHDTPSSGWHRGFSISACHCLKLLDLCSALLDVLMQGISEFQ